VPCSLVKITYVSEFRIAFIMREMAMQETSVNFCQALSISQTVNNVQRSVPIT
jgi:hypothetical protein